MANHPPLVAPANNGASTSPWFALRYVKNQLPNLSPHDLIKLVAGIGADTKGKFTFQAIVHRTNEAKQNGVNVAANPSWHGYVGRVIHAAVTHHHKDWVQGFTYGSTSSDIPGTGGPSNLQKVADSGAANAVVSGTKHVGNALGDIGKLFTGSNLIGIIILVIIVIVVLGKK